jgi:hypothetical protein
LRRGRAGGEREEQGRNGRTAKSGCHLIWPLEGEPPIVIVPAKYCGIVFRQELWAMVRAPG